MRRIFDRSRVEAYCGPTTLYQTVAEILPWVFFLITVIVLIAGWGRIPERVPMHSDFQGNVTDWGEKNDLIWLVGAYLFITLLLFIVGWFPQTWNNGIRIRSIGLGRGNNSVRSYRLTRDLLCDMRIGMSLLFSGLLLWTAFGGGQGNPLAINIAVFAAVLIPLARYLIRMYLFR